MNNTNNFLNNLLYPMSSVNNEWNVLDETQPAFSAYDTTPKSNFSISTGRPETPAGALLSLADKATENKEKGNKEMFVGALFKTVSAASDFFSRTTGILAGQTSAIHGQRDVAIKNYENEMAALDNQVLNLKNQLSDRFNKTVDTNIMTLAAKNLRVSAGNVLELSKKEAQEITEDIQIAESNAKLKKIALEAGKKQVKESSKLAIKQMWTGLVGSAANLGLAIATGGGTGESFGNLYARYSGYSDWNSMQAAKDAEKAMKTGSFNSIY